MAADHGRDGVEQLVDVEWLSYDGLNDIRLGASARGPAAEHTTTGVVDAER